LRLLEPRVDVLMSGLLPLAEAMRDSATCQVVAGCRSFK
jgi:hypothetical protein